MKKHTTCFVVTYLDFLDIQSPTFKKIVNFALIAKTQTYLNELTDIQQFLPIWINKPKHRSIPALC